MKLARIVIFLILLGCGLCTLGLSQATKLRLSISAPDDAFNLYDRIHYLDNQLASKANVDAESIAPAQLISWEEVLRKVENPDRVKKEFYVEWDEIEYLVLRYIFSFSTRNVSPVNLWYRMLWDFRKDAKSRNLTYSSFHIRKMLMDPDQEDIRRAMLSKLAGLLNSEDTEGIWYQQKAEFLEDFSSRNPEYDKLSKATYRSTLKSKLQEAIDAINTTDYDRKALPVWMGFWQTVETKNGVLVYHTQDYISGICYRIGRDASFKLKAYLQQLKDQI